MKKLLPLLVVALLAAACGDSGGSGGDTASVALEDFAINPQTVTIEAGNTTTVEVSNIGGIQHSWVVLNQSEAPASTDEIDVSKILADSGDLEGGQSASLDVTIAEPGTYAVVCAIAGHVEAGMVGSLEVTG